jgi:hypothetical protein
MLRLKFLFHKDKGKSFKQLEGIENGYLAIDTDLTTHKRKIPLWLFRLIE